MTSMKNLVVGMAAVTTLSLLAPASAMAGWKRYDRHSATDPYAYHYDHRGYYPYYGSDYWRPAHKVKNRRFHYKQPRYHKAWGYYKKHISQEHHSHPHGTVRHPHRHHKHHW
ncbi:MAG: hypothetical protein JXQ99_12425 [Hyphomicrobiaceae bacterium]